MAYRRRQGGFGGGKDWTNMDDEINNTILNINNNNNNKQALVIESSSSSSSSSSSLAAKAIRASSSFRDSSLSSAYHSSSLSFPPPPPPSSSFKPSTIHDDYIPPLKTKTSAPQPPKQGFWELLARKAKGVIDDERPPFPIPHSSTRDQATESRRKTDNPALQKGIDAITSSLNYFGGTLSNALEEGLTIVENRTADIIQETRKLQIKKKDHNSEVQNQTSTIYGARQEPLMQKHMQPQMHTDLEIQLKASRDVAMAMAAKAKLLLRELKTVKADLAFAKERCGQLEEENRILRENSGKGDNPEDDDLIRLQLESLLAEKARLAQENSVFARENRFLREIVEYHQLTMQDVVYLDENNEDVTEVYPIKSPTVINLQPSGTIASSLPSPTPPSAAQRTTPTHVPHVVSSKQTPS